MVNLSFATYCLDFIEWHGWVRKSENGFVMISLFQHQTFLLSVTIMKFEIEQVNILILECYASFKFFIDVYEDMKKLLQFSSFLYSLVDK